MASVYWILLLRPNWSVPEARSHNRVLLAFELSNLFDVFLQNIRDHKIALIMLRSIEIKPVLRWEYFTLLVLITKLYLDISS